ncbi:hypothetical protein [Nocardia wallacei]|uniref:hypothetical protein n=1 Tax=Nocardia wallacei TaxID=480035 RepID=UPI00245838D5|nr:hypothetical protein [Nocardia wallacei]
MTATTSRQLRDDIQDLIERTATLVGADHPAISTLMTASDQLASEAITDAPRRYGNLSD